jgi:hypothetical protein
VVLAPSGKWVAVLGCALLAAFAVWDIVVTEQVSLQLVGHARDYAAAVEASGGFTTVGEARDHLSVLPTATFVSYAVSSVGLLLVTVAMAKAAFARPATAAGVVAGLTGVIGGFYPTIPGLTVLLTPSLIAFGLWAILTGRHLLTMPTGSPRLSRSSWKLRWRSPA